tara:strand:- start:257 stop:1462 length:1206 start_codon:yes stop_codon:yes gene_type:complete
MPKLKRELGLFRVTLAGVGVILGAGIYALIGVAAGKAGNATWLAFLISAFIALFTGLSYAELSSMFRGDSGEYHYVTKALNKKFAWFIGISVIMASVITCATVSLGFAGYFTSLLSLPFILATVLVLALMATINFLGIKESSWFNAVATFIEFTGLVLIIIFGISHIGSVNYLEMPNGFFGVFSSAALIFFAFLGFENIIKLSEETKNPQKTIPKAILLSIAITSVLYVLVAISAVSVVGWDALSQSVAPLALVAQTALGTLSGVVLAIIALFSTSNTILVSMLTSSRQVYGMAKEKGLPKVFASVHENTRTPWLAIILVMVLAMLFSLIGEIETVASITNLFLFITFGSVNLSLMILRYKMPKRKRYFTCPGRIGKLALIPLFGFLSSIVMIVFILINLL